MKKLLSISVALMLALSAFSQTSYNGSGTQQRIIPTTTAFSRLLLLQENGVGYLALITTNIYTLTNGFISPLLVTNYMTNYVPSYVANWFITNGVITSNLLAQFGYANTNQTWLGTGATEVDGTSVAIGIGASGQATGGNSVSIGYQAYSLAGVSLGYMAQGSVYGIAIGDLANARITGAALCEAVAIGVQAQADSLGVAVGGQSSSTNYGVALGAFANASGVGNAAIGGTTNNVFGPGAAVVTSNFTDTVELGRGIAPLNGGLNFRGHGIVDSNLTLQVPSMNTVTNFATAPATLNVITMGTPYVNAGNRATLDVNYLITLGGTNQSGGLYFINQTTAYSEFITNSLFFSSPTNIGAVLLTNKVSGHYFTVIGPNETILFTNISGASILKSQYRVW